MTFKTKLRVRSIKLTSFTLAAAVVAASSAHGAGFGLKEQSAYGQGSSFAGVAAGGAISTSFWNPATIAEVGDEKEYEVMGSLISGETDIETTGTSNLIYTDLEDTGDVAGDLTLLPAGFLAGRVNDKTAWGVSLTIPYGLGSEADRGSKSQYVALKTEANSVNVSPTITYEAAPGFNVAAGLQFQTFGAVLTQAIPVGAAVGRFSATDPVLKIEGDDTGSIGYTLGFTYEKDATTFGVGYRSSVDNELEGTFEVDALGVDSPVSLDLETPSTLSLGVKHKLNDKWILAGTHNQTEWSSVGDVPVISDATGAPIVFGGNAVILPFRYQDTTFTSIGADYQYTPKMTIRAGIGLDETVTSDTTRTTRLPDEDRYWLSAGASYQLAKGQLDWGFTHVFLKDEAEVNIGPGHVAFNRLPYTGKSDPKVNILSVSFKGRF